MIFASALNFSHSDSVTAGTHSLTDGEVRNKREDSKLRKQLIRENRGVSAMMIELDDETTAVTRLSVGFGFVQQQHSNSTHVLNACCDCGFVTYSIIWLVV